MARHRLFVAILPIIALIRCLKGLFDSPSAQTALLDNHRVPTGHISNDDELRGLSGAGGLATLRRGAQSGDFIETAGLMRSTGRPRYESFVECAPGILSLRLHGSRNSGRL